MLALGSLLAIALGCLITFFPLLLRLLRRRAAVRRHCPGPAARSRLFRVVGRLLAVRRGRCGYDLSGHFLYPRPRVSSSRSTSTDCQGQLTCPECGRSIVRYTDLLPRPRSWRLVHLGAVMLFGGLLGIRTILHSTEAKATFLPTDALLWIETHWDRSTPSTVRHVIRQRYADDEMNERQMRAMILLHLRDLRDDDVRGNAKKARSHLYSYGLKAVAPLEEALDSPDSQQREMAASLLCSMKEHRPTQRLLEVLLEQLRSDRFPGDRPGRRYRWAHRAYVSEAYLKRHSVRAAPLLAEGMQSDDPQQRYLSALIAAESRCHTLMPQAAAILLEHLRNNAVSNDATDSKAALRFLGPDVVPHIRHAAWSSDFQQRRLVRELIIELSPHQAMIDGFIAPWEYDAHHRAGHSGRTQQAQRTE